MKTKIHRLIAALLTAVIVFAMVPVFSFAAGWETISTAAELKAFADKVNDGDTYKGKTVVLTANINLKGTPENPWTPIAQATLTTTSLKFEGTFDGQNHVISGLYVENPKVTAQGLFGYVDGGTVKNLVVSGTVIGSTNAGGIVGSLWNGGTIENCGNLVNVTAVHNVGGIVGGSWSRSNGTTSQPVNNIIRNCYNRGDITSTGSSNGSAPGVAGGIIGEIYHVIVENCYNTGTITAEYTGEEAEGANLAAKKVGGIAGTGYPLKNCYNVGQIRVGANSSDSIGSLTGSCYSAEEVDNCYYLTGTAERGIGQIEYEGNDPSISMSETDMKAGAFIGKLGSVFVSDKKGLNNGYPVLAWEPGIGTDTPDTAFTERTELSAELAQYIRAAVNSAKTNKGLSAAASLLGSETYISGASSTATDWMALAMGRFGYFDSDSYSYLISDGDGYAAYLAAMKAYIESTYQENGGKLHTVKATEWYRAIVTIEALGGDPTNFGTYNGKPIDLVADGCYNCVLSRGPGTQDINGWIWGLIALDAGGYAVPSDAKYSRETFITEILKAQLADGGWALSGQANADVDMTGMALQALAPYYNDDTVYTYENAASKQTVAKTVRQCVNEALDCLSVRMNADGGFSSSWEGENSESIAQVVVALCSLGIDPAKDARFLTAEGKTVLDALLRFQLDGGGFRHTASGKWNSMANDQATYAMVAYWRMENAMRSLYDMRANWTAAERAAIDAAVVQIDALPELSADPTYKAALKAALDTFQNVPQSERRYVYNYNRLAAAIELVGGKDALADPSLPYIMSISVTQKPNKTEYYEAEKFDPTGMVVTTYYSDGSEASIEGYIYAPTGLLTRENTEIRITYGILETSVAITVTPAPDLQIETVEDILSFRDQVNAGNNFKDKIVTLTADLDMSGVTDWYPIANSGASTFQGTFDGQYHVIKNLTSATAGIFGYAGADAVIRNFGLESGTINTSISNIGGIVCYCNGASVINCWNGADITISAYAGYSGGVVGRATGGLISGCYNTGAIHAVDGPLGGVAGYLPTNANVTVENCYNIGAVTLEAGGWWAGGVVGQIQNNNTLKNCYNAGRISGEESGAVVGFIGRGITAQNCYYDSGVFANGTGDGSYADKIIGKPAQEMCDGTFAASLGTGFKEDSYGLVNNHYPLLNWQKTEKADALHSVIEKIKAIGAVTLDSADAIGAAKSAYNALDAELKPYISDYAKILEQAEKTWAELLQKAKDDAKKDLEAYKDLSDYRDEQKKAQKKIVDEAKTAIDAATDADAISKAVEEAKTKMDAVKTAKELDDEEAAQAVMDQIAGIGKVTLEKETAIQAARKAYGGLSAKAKALVANYEVLVKAETELAALKKSDDSPQTGDIRNFPLLFVFMAASLSGIVTLADVKKKKQ